MLDKHYEDTVKQVISKTILRKDNTNAHIKYNYDMKSVGLLYLCEKKKKTHEHGFFSPGAITTIILINGNTLSLYKSNGKRQ